MKKFWLFFCVFTIVTLICDASYAAAGRSDMVSPSQLNANVDRYNGMHVVVRGYVKLSPEGHIIYESQEKDAEFRKEWDSGRSDFDPNLYNKYCLTIANPNIFYRDRNFFNGKTVILIGKFIRYYMDAHAIDLGACPLPTAIIVDEDDLKRRYRALFPRR